MSLQRRIARLEAGTADLDIAQAYCPTCGGAVPGYDLLVLMENHQGQSLEPLCPDCGHRVNEQGRAAWARAMPRTGTVVIKKIILDRPPWVPAPRVGRKRAG